MTAHPIYAFSGPSMVQDKTPMPPMARIPNREPSIEGSDFVQGGADRAAKSCTA